MIYAIISDIHGNYPALEAVLADAEAQGADKYLFLGDYYRNYPWGNEVAETLRMFHANKNAAIIRGNNENYLIGLSGQGQGAWEYEQFKLVYYCYRSFSPENIEFLKSLPETATVCDMGDGCDIHLIHNSTLFIRSPRIVCFSSIAFRRMAMTAPFTHEEYLTRAREALLSSPDALREIGELPEGIYLHGHNHLQYHIEFGGSLFINPGSCGDPCDGSPTAAYTLLECRPGGSRTVTERRVTFDLEATASGLRGSALAAEAPVWAGIIEKQLMSGYDYFGPFVMHIGEVGRKHGQEHMPVTNDVWEEAVATWDPEYLKPL